MNVMKFYDTYCEKCGNWYSSTFAAPQTNNKNEAINEMKKNGWVKKEGKTICHKCSE